MLDIENEIYKMILKCIAKLPSQSCSCVVLISLHTIPMLKMFFIILYFLVKEYEELPKS